MKNCDQIEYLFFNCNKILKPVGDVNALEYNCSVLLSL